MRKTKRKETNKMAEKEVIQETVDKVTYEKIVTERDVLKQQLEELIRRYKKLSVLYNEAIEKILSE